MKIKGRPTDLSKGNGVPYGHNHPADTSYGEPDLATQHMGIAEWSQQLRDQQVMAGVRAPETRRDIKLLGEAAYVKHKK